MFVRLFVDENLDRMVPISKQPKDKIQAILDACDRQFPEFHERSRKRIRTYLKSCRRMRRSKEQNGWESVSICALPLSGFGTVETFNAWSKNRRGDDVSHCFTKRTMIVIVGFDTWISSILLSWWSRKVTNYSKEVLVLYQCYSYI